MADDFDVWFVAADAVYTGVPVGVVTGWAEQGRLAADDKVRPAGVRSPWVRAADHPLVGDFLYAPTASPLAAADPAHEALEPVELDLGWGRPHPDEDEDVDMIPLIDISLVLLIFFMMTATVSSMAPVDVPPVKHTADLRNDPGAVTVQVDRRAGGEPVWAVRVGERVAPEDNNLPTVGDALARARARVSEATEPPVVRVACHKDLPRSHVLDVTREFDKLLKDKRIARYEAEVADAK